MTGEDRTGAGGQGMHIAMQGFQGRRLRTCIRPPRRDDETEEDHGDVEGIRPHSGATEEDHLVWNGDRRQQMERSYDTRLPYKSASGGSPAGSVATGAASSSRQRCGRHRHGPSTAVGPTGRSREGLNGPIGVAHYDQDSVNSGSDAFVSSEACNSRESPPRARLRREQRAVLHGGREEAAALLPCSRRDLIGAVDGDKTDEGNALDAAAGNAERLGTTQFEDQNLPMEIGRVDQASPIKRRRLRGKQRPPGLALLSASTFSAASGSGEPTVDSTAYRLPGGVGPLVARTACRGPGDGDAVGSAAINVNSMHDSVIAMRTGHGGADDRAGVGGVGGNGRQGSIAGGSGWSPSRFALHLLTEQRLPGLGHRDGLHPAAGSGAATPSWLTRGGRPPDAAAERAA